MKVECKVCYVVDDDPEDRDLFLMAVGDIPEKKVEVHAFASGTELVNRLLISSLSMPDYIFIDINMPGMNGFDCLNIIKQQIAVNNSVKLIMVSTSNSSNDIQRSKSLGANSYVVKPYSLKSYTKLLGQLIY